MDNNLCFLAVQNGVILDVCSSKEDAERRVREEIKRDMLQILLKKKLRKLLKKTGDVSLHEYSVLTVCASEVIDT